MLSIEKKPFWAINPDSTLKQKWDMLVMLLVVYISYSTPLSLGFLSDEHCSPTTTEIRSMQARCAEFSWSSQWQVAFFTALMIDQHKCN